VTLVMSNLVSVHLETVFVLVQDRCMICTKRTIGSVIVLDEAQVEARFGPFGHSANLDSR
jgi:hypothetical protein